MNRQPITRWARAIVVDDVAHYRRFNDQPPQCWKGSAENPDVGQVVNAHTWKAAGGQMCEHCWDVPMVAIMIGVTTIGVVAADSIEEITTLANHPGSTAVTPPDAATQRLRISGPKPSLEQLLAAEAIANTTQGFCWWAA